MRYDRQELTTTRDERLDEVVNAFTPLMWRLCGFIRADELEAMIERMAHNHLAARTQRASHLRPPLSSGVSLGTRRAARPGASSFQRTARPQS
jgi:hypothetical protein